MIDLHIHSTFSDGTYTPEEIVLEAKQKGLAAIALTDHDTVSGIKASQEAGQKQGLQVISGVELSASYHQREIHILGYDIDCMYRPFLDALNEFAQRRLERNQIILDKLAQQGILLELSDLTSQSNHSTILTRAHFANALLRKGYVRYRQEAFDRYLGDGKPACVPKELLPAQECIRLIHEAGGYAVLAHPTLYKLNKVRMYELIHTLKREGLDGIECIYPSYTPAQKKEFLKLCTKFNLFPTGGSDFHGANKAQIQLGIGTGQLDVPQEFLAPFSNRQ